MNNKVSAMKNSKTNKNIDKNYTTKKDHDDYGYSGKRAEKRNNQLSAWD